jgi:hypothetical protein
MARSNDSFGAIERLSEMKNEDHREVSSGIAR